jgi:hypothetical protein
MNISCQSHDLDAVVSVKNLRYLFDWRLDWFQSRNDRFAENNILYLSRESNPDYPSVQPVA